MPLPHLSTAVLVQPVSFLGQVLLAGVGLVRGRARISARDLARVSTESSARALPIVTGVNLLVGSILAFVGAVQLVKFGAGIYVADLVGIAVAREMAAVITAVVMCGRTGAAFAAELATMQANEEIDAYEVLGIDPVPYLVLPRVLSLLLLLPLLYIYACLAGLVGGALVGSGMLQLAPQAYMDRTAIILGWSHLGLGLVKSVVFGALIGIVGCYCGLHAQRNAAGVGRATTKAVVVSIVGVIVVDSLFAILANAVGV
ncbi:MlaE family ABC transporter permease [Azohydromonas lata]|uniref:ABC transporter permease n=1 Tax=Azohydromonas lata TaxID=45677 RepID=A0ABU5II84_9BURK|nr:ABC transporter permease [Azohydromonas lata]MDZ5458210.1 ABC transporter permease [Azohydromonas lata]